MKKKQKTPFRFKAKKLHCYKIIESIRHYKDWMFVKDDVSNVEILPPTLDNITLMKNYGYKFVVKGFKSLCEYNMFEHLRVEYGIASMMYASRCLGNNFMLNMFNSLANDLPLPDSDEVDQALEENRLTIINDSVSEKQLKEKEKYKRLSERYFILLHRKLFDLIKQKRLQNLL